MTLLLDPVLQETRTEDSAVDVIEFVMSDAYLGKKLYPRQATLLKVIFLQDELFTSYDHQVLDEWASGFSLPPRSRRKMGDPLRYEGYEGIQPDVYDRIAINQEAGRKWFREIINVAGRRGSKGYIGGLCGAYVLYHYILMGDPQGHFGVDRAKALTAFVFAGKREQAKINQWQDLVDAVVESPYLARYVSDVMGETLRVKAPNDWKRQEARQRLGIKSARDIASFQILAKESTKNAGRGPASFIQYYDEMAHVVREVASADAGEVYDSSTPALDQFRGRELIYAGSSPWQMLGKFYELYQGGLEIDPTTGDPFHPERLVVQLPSWGLYKDWERAHQIPRVSHNGAEASSTVTEEGTKVSAHGKWNVTNQHWMVKAFPKVLQPVQLYDDQMRREEKSNPETFKVERRARWATAMDAYFNAKHVEEMFGPYNPETFTSEGGHPLKPVNRGVLSRTYRMHGDPSKTNDNFGYAVAHVEGPDANGLLHVVFDQIGAWKAEDFPEQEYDEGHRIDYLYIEEEWKSKVEAFVPEVVTFDQYSSVSLIAHLREHVQRKQLPRRVQISEVTATAPLNWKMAETMKMALNLKLVHAPFDELAYQEFIFLQDLGTNKVDHPSSGPVQTKDIYDSMANIVYAFIGDELQGYIAGELSAGLEAAVPGGLPQAMDGDRDDLSERFSDFGRPNARGREYVSPARGTVRSGRDVPSSGSRWVR